MITKDKLCKCGCGKSGKIWSKGMLKQCFFRLNPSKSIKKSYLSKKPTEKQIQKKQSLYDLENECFYVWKCS